MSRFRFQKLWPMVLAFVIGCCLALGLVFMSNVEQTSSRNSMLINSNCRQISQLKVVITGVVNTALTVIGTPGSAGYQYYLSHPTELAAAKQQLHQEIYAFRPQACS